MCSEHKKLLAGMTIMEVLITIAVSAVLASVVGILMISGQRCWNQTYNAAHRQIKQDAPAVTSAFGSIARKANRLNYKIYQVENGTFTKAVGPVTGLAVVTGQAVEFRYWTADTPDESLLNITNTGTHYALFYLENGKLKIDYGRVQSSDVGAVNGTAKTTPDNTVILSENVSSLEFSHTTSNGMGMGCVRINLTLTDPDDGRTINVMTASTMRNIWPR